MYTESEGKAIKYACLDLAITEDTVKFLLTKDIKFEPSTKQREQNCSSRELRKMHFIRLSHLGKLLDVLFQVGRDCPCKVSSDSTLNLAMTIENEMFEKLSECKYKRMVVRKSESLMTLWWSFRDDMHAQKYKRGSTAITVNENSSDSPSSASPSDNGLDVEAELENLGHNIREFLEDQQRAIKFIDIPSIKSWQKSISRAFRLAQLGRLMEADTKHFSTDPNWPDHGKLMGATNEAIRVENIMFTNSVDKLDYTIDVILRASWICSNHKNEERMRLEKLNGKSVGNSSPSVSPCSSVDRQTVTSAAVTDRSTPLVDLTEGSCTSSDSSSRKRKLHERDVRNNGKTEAPPTKKPDEGKTAPRPASDSIQVVERNLLEPPGVLAASSGDSHNTLVNEGSEANGTCTFLVVTTDYLNGLPHVVANFLFGRYTNHLFSWELTMKWQKSIRYESKIRCVGDLMAALLVAENIQENDQPGIANAYNRAADTEIHIFYRSKNIEDYLGQVNIAINDILARRVMVPDGYNVTHAPAENTTQHPMATNKQSYGQTSAMSHTNYPPIPRPLNNSFVPNTPYREPWLISKHVRSCSIRRFVEIITTFPTSYLSKTLGDIIIEAKKIENIVFFNATSSDDYNYRIYHLCEAKKRELYDLRKYGVISDPYDAEAVWEREREWEASQPQQFIPLHQPQHSATLNAGTFNRPGFSGNNMPPTMNLNAGIVNVPQPNPLQESSTASTTASDRNSLNRPPLTEKYRATDGGRPTARIQHGETNLRSTEDKVAYSPDDGCRKELMSKNVAAGQRTQLASESVDKPPTNRALLEMMQQSTSGTRKAGESRENQKSLQANKTKPNSNLKDMQNMKQDTVNQNCVDLGLSSPTSSAFINGQPQANPADRLNQSNTPIKDGDPAAPIV